MGFRRFAIFSLALLLAAGFSVSAAAAETDCGSVYCFGEEDFSPALSGICITRVPEASQGQLLLGSRILAAGDILTAAQLKQMSFQSRLREEDAVAVISYLPIYADRVESADTVTLAIRGRKDQPPAASDSAGETYRDLPLEGRLTVREPEGQTMTFTVTRNPRRGTVELHGDGSFTYTPKKNKVGVDSFVFTATDEAGNVSREATVTITVLKPGSTEPYTDTEGKSCRFAAEWMKNTGIFQAESLDGKSCFSPERQVTRGQFVTMLVNALELKVDETVTYTGYTDEIPSWLRPYVAAAVRAGLTAGLPMSETFGAEEPISCEEAAVMLQNALDLTAVETAADADAPAPTALEILSRYGIALTGETLTRADAAQALYQAAKLADEAPGTLALQAIQ